MFVEPHAWTGHLYLLVNAKGSQRQRLPRPEASDLNGHGMCTEDFESSPISLNKATSLVLSAGEKIVLIVLI